MKLILYLIFLLTITNRTVSQNLVPNSSFEEYSNCPGYFSNPTNEDTEVNIAISWSSYRYSPNYLNSCCPKNEFYSIPQNSFGYQFAATGNGYCGIYTFSKSYQDYREIFGCKLLSPLVIGETYFVSFKVNAASSDNGIHLYTNNLGIKFSTVPFETFEHPIAVNNFAHINSDIIIIDTTNWLTIQGSFVADSTYQYLALGNFFDDAHTKIGFDNSTETKLLAYYYVDDVKVSTDKNEAWTDTLFVLAGITDPWTIFPNPVSVELTVSAAIPTQKIEIYSVIGQELLSVNTSALPQSTSYKIFVGDLAAGYYFIRIRGGGYRQTKKFIVTH